MIKILFCLQTMVCGGVEKELITILKRFDRSRYDVSVLLLYEQEAEMIKQIPGDIKVVNLDIDREYYCSGLPGLVKNRLKRRCIVEAIGLALKKAFGIGTTAANVKLHGLPQISEEFDYAVCYHMHSPIVLRYVADNVCAKHKIAWIHNDFSTTGYDISKFDKWLRKYNKFVAVSDQLGDEFKTECPRYAQFTVTVHNIVDVNEIREKASNLSEVDSLFFEDNNIKIVTVGRLVEQKGIDIAIKACKKLVAQQVPITWYVVGGGKDEPYLRQLIVSENIENNFNLLGEKANPYPYIACADFYVQPSRHEGFVITVEEAKVLNKVIVCTDFAGAREQIDHGINGIITSECNAECISDELKKLIDNPDLGKKFTEQMNDDNSDSGWCKIESIFN